MAKKIEGIGGWLLVLIFDLIFSSISNSFILFGKINQKGISSFFLGAYILFTTITLFMILFKKRAAIRTFIAGALAGAAFLIWDFLVLPFGFLSKNPKALFFNLFFIIANITITVIITLYLLKSKRVKNTLKK